jgi:subtilisin-like proprotein convertase family protein
VAPTSPGWIENKAVGTKKYSFNPQFGFGRANAKAAVDLAANYSLNLGTFESELVQEQALNLNITEGASAPLQRNLVVQNTADTPNLIIEAVEVMVDITHPNPNQLKIEILSPSATNSTLVDTSTEMLSSADMPQISLLTNAFYGEASTGSWRIKVSDLVTGNTGKLNSWGVKVYGHRP